MRGRLNKKDADEAQVHKDALFNAQQELAGNRARAVAQRRATNADVRAQAARFGTRTVAGRRISGIRRDMWLLGPSMRCKNCYEARKALKEAGDDLYKQKHYKFQCWNEESLRL